MRGPLTIPRIGCTFLQLLSKVLRTENEIDHPLSFAICLSHSTMDQNNTCQLVHSLDSHLPQQPEVTVHNARLHDNRQQCPHTGSSAAGFQPDLHVYRDDLSDALASALRALGSSAGLRSYRNHLCEVSETLLADADLPDPNARLRSFVRDYAWLCMLPNTPVSALDGFRAKVAFRLVLGSAGDLLAFLAGTPSAIDHCLVNKVVSAIGGNCLYLPNPTGPFPSPSEIGNVDNARFASVMASYESDLADDTRPLNARALLDSLYEGFIDDCGEPAPLGVLWARASSDDRWTNANCARIAAFWNLAVDLAIVSGYDRALQANRNKLMHALNGNSSQPQPQRQRKAPRSRPAAKKTTAVQKKRGPPARKPDPRLLPMQSKIREVRDTMNAIAYSIAACGSMPAIRWGSSYATVQTATAMPYVRRDVPWTATAVPNAGYQSLPQTDFVAFAFRDYLCSNIIYDPNRAALPSQYTMYGVGVLAANLQATVPAASWTENTVGYVKLPLFIPYAKPTTGISYTYAPHGQLWPASADEGNNRARFYWFDAGTTVSLNVVTDVNTGIRFFLDSWTMEGIHDGTYSASTDMVAGVAQDLVLPLVVKPGYYSLNVLTFYDCAVTLSNVWCGLGTGSHFCHLTAPEFMQNTPSVDSVRVNGASILYTNRAAEMYKEGSIAMCQVPVGDNWTEYVAADGSGFSRMSKSNIGTEMTAKKGAYVWLKPGQPTDHEFLQYHTVQDGMLIDCRRPLKPRAAFIGMYAQIDVGLYQNARMTMSIMLEYQTLDTWRDLKYAPAAAAVFEEALSQLKKAPQFCENPIHLKSIWNAIKSGAGFAANAITKYGPKVAQVAELIAAM